jgi:hypothetical protein
MRGVLIDVNLRGQMERVRTYLEGPPWDEFWRAINVPLLTFEGVGLDDEAPDDQVWRRCQQEQWVLVTGNRNEEDESSLEATINRENSADSLPVLTIGRPAEVLTSTEYADRVTEKFLDYLLDIDRFRGTGRLYLP